MSVSWVIIDSDNGLVPAQRQAITWINSDFLLIGPLGTKIRGILIAIRTSSLKKMHFKMLSAKGQPFRLSLNMLSNMLMLVCSSCHQVISRHDTMLIIYDKQVFVFYEEGYQRPAPSQYKYQEIIEDQNISLCSPKFNTSRDYMLQNHGQHAKG